MAEYTLNRKNMNDPREVASQMYSTLGRGRTSRSSDPTRNVNNTTMFNMSEMLMNIPAMGSTAATLGQFEAMVSGTLGGLFTAEDEDDNQAGALIPLDILAKIASMGLDPFGGEGEGSGEGSSPGAGDGGNAATGSARKLISVAKGYVGTTEKPPNSNRQPFAAIAGHANGQYWCNTYTSACFKEAGLLDEWKRNTPLVMATHENYKKIDRIGNNPQVGALIFYKWGSRGNWVNHIGIVTGFDSSTVYTVEGNTSKPGGGSQSNGGGVFEKQFPLNHSAIRGFAYPEYPAKKHSPSITE